MQSLLLKQIWYMTRCALYGLFLQSLLCSMLLANEGSAQNMKLKDVRLTLELNEVRLTEAFVQIERQVGFNFIYEKNLAKGSRKVSLKAENQNMYDLLYDFSRKVNVQFKRVNENIYVTRKSSFGKIDYNVIDQTLVDISISGKVSDENGEGLPGASIVVSGTNIGTTTNLDGKYKLTVPEHSILSISFVGYRTQEITIGAQAVVNVQMDLDAAQLEEIVVVGYGAVKKGDLTGSVSKVKSDELQAVPVYNIEQALKSRAAGVRVTQNSGSPGARIEVRIRGGNSMIGSNGPLYVVDGFPVTGGINFLNPADIESIDILKDASATAIYGSRGANGVVIITSKRGKTGQKGKIEFSSFYGIQQDVKRAEVLDAREYAIVANELLTNSGQVPFFDLDEITDSGTDWQDQIFRSAPIHNHTISFSGSNEKTRYSLSGNYFDQVGIIINSGIKRGSLKLNLDSEINPWVKMSTNLNLSRRNRLEVPVDNGNYGGGSILAAALSAAPTLPVYDENGLPTRVGEAYSWGEATMQNPMIYAGARKNATFSNLVIGNISLDFKLAEGLTFKTLLGLEYDNYIQETFSPKIYSNDRGGASERAVYRNSFLNENILSYSKNFDENNKLDVIGGFTYQTNLSRTYSDISVSGFANNTTENYDLSAAETINTPSSGYSEWTLISWLARANYSLKSKYLFTFSVRTDGSSRFGKDNKWGVFPSGAFAWRISDEVFMDNIEAISDLKFRASYGITGNTALNPYQSLDRLSSVKTIYGNQSDEIGFVPSGIANNQLKWETTAQMDFGVDLNLMDNRLRFTFDYYKKNTTDLLASVPLPPSIGFGSVLKNIGEIQNQGVEVSVSADIFTQALKWNVSGNISTNRNKVVTLADGNDIYGSELNLFRSSLNIARVGEPFGSFYGLLEDGLDENGKIKYIDTNKDEVINSLDRVIIGNPYPDIIFGFNSNLSFKNFELNLFLEGVHGNDLFWASAGTHLNAFQRGNNQFADIIGNSWTAENPNPNAKYPVISPSTLIDVSDRFIYDGSYLRVKSIKLAYNFPTEKIAFFDQAQVYVSGTNLLTFTSYPGTDPEANTTGTDSQSVGSRLRMGFDQSAYPSARTFAVGLKLNF